MRIISEKNSMGTAMFTRSQDPLMMKLAKRLDERAGVLAGDNFESLIKNILEKKVSFCISYGTAIDRNATRTSSRATTLDNTSY